MPQRLYWGAYKNVGDALASKQLKVSVMMIITFSIIAAPHIQRKLKLWEGDIPLQCCRQYIVGPGF